MRVEGLQTLCFIVEFFEAELFRSSTASLSWERIVALVLDVLVKESHSMKIQALKAWALISYHIA